MHLFDPLPEGKQEHGAIFIVGIVVTEPVRLQ